jgi:hypothetical protein
MILKAELTAKNKFAATVTQAVPALSYSFGVIRWRLKTKKRHKIRKILRVYKVHHSEAEIVRLG